MKIAHANQNFSKQKRAKKYRQENTVGIKRIRKTAPKQNKIE